jgi:peptidoglycan/xylan/chitin deacetylase (PgdA/CDA1 family)
MPAAVVRRLISRGVSRVVAEEGRIYLTYDDGPDPEVTPQLLDILAEAKARATFFVVASIQPWWPVQIRTIAAAGHAIGFHGMRHRSNFFVSNHRIHQDLERLAERISQAGATAVNLYRPPFGHVRPDTVKYLRERGIETVLWSSIPGDFRPLPIEKLLSRALRDLRPGAIFALHDGVRHRPAPVLELTRELLADIWRRGWKCASLADIIEG